MQLESVLSDMHVDVVNSWPYLSLPLVFFTQHMILVNVICVEEKTESFAPNVLQVKTGMLPSPQTIGALCRKLRAHPVQGPWVSGHVYAIINQNYMVNS